MSQQFQSYKSGEIEYKVSVSKQIDRIAELFSQKMDERSNVRQTQKVMIESQTIAINIFERMLQPYHDEDYKTAIKKLKEEMKTIEGMTQKQEFAEKKFGLLMELMNRKRMLMEETVEEVQEGEIPEESEEDAPISEG